MRMPMAVETIESIEESERREKMKRYSQISSRKDRNFAGMKVLRQRSNSQEGNVKRTQS